MEGQQLLTFFNVLPFMSAMAYITKRNTITRFEAQHLLQLGHVKAVLYIQFPKQNDQCPLTFKKLPFRRNEKHKRIPYQNTTKWLPIHEGEHAEWNISFSIIWQHCTEEMLRVSTLAEVPLCLLLSNKFLRKISSHTSYYVPNQQSENTPTKLGNEIKQCARRPYLSCYLKLFVSSTE